MEHTPDPLPRYFWVNAWRERCIGPFGHITAEERIQPFQGAVFKRRFSMRSILR